MTKPEPRIGVKLVISVTMVLFYDKEKSTSYSVGIQDPVDNSIDAANLRKIWISVSIITTTRCNK